jgi:uncharacterized paraquat-inducible protein A
MKCLKCDFDGNPNLEESGPHTKAICPKCGKYIKMVSKNELQAIIAAPKPQAVLEGVEYYLEYVDAETVRLIKK